jgi:hypothetical protein
MPSLVLGVQPGFTELADSTFDAGNGATAATLKSLNASVKFAAVRTEEFWGYYKNGETVVLPVSPADGYQYSRSELRYVWSVFWTGAAPSSDLLGTQTAPSRGATTGAGNLLALGFNIVQSSGAVTCNVSYYKSGGSQTDTNDGILLVTTIAKRAR